MQEPQRGTAGDEEFVEFARTGERAMGAFECVGCGYGAVVREELPSCPMCQGTLWERTEWAPFASALSGLRRIAAR
ncbi:MAG TPA: hypothetical protein VF063_09670 [Gaiellaceae bacterium]